MRTIENKFRKIQAKHPEWGDYICFRQAIAGRKFQRRAIREAFMKLISTEDYERKDLNALLTQLTIASNIVVDDHFEKKIKLFDVKNDEDDRDVKS